MPLLTGLARQILSRAGIGVVRTETLDELLEKATRFDSWSPERDFRLLQSVSESQRPTLMSVLKDSRSQLRQDAFVLAQLDFKRNGFFVEFGAANGVFLSNTYLLEKEFGWSGILAEPARCWHAELRRNRTAAIDTRCVWTTSGSTVTFNEVSAGELSTIDAFSSSDGHADRRKRGTTYDVETISLNDLLDRHHAPATIDYLSLDTEGSEFDILSSVDFSRRSFSVITYEHTYRPARDKIHALLTGHGYVRRFEELSRFDDWYVRAS